MPIFAIAMILLLAACAGLPADALRELPDAPEPGYAKARTAPSPSSYDAALAQWKSAEALSDWIGARFEYDGRRALDLSETARSAGRRVQVHRPEAFFTAPAGVCVDLTHFAVSTLRHIAPQSRPAYLMIEFEPVSVAGHTLRRHWIASYEKDGALYFFGDSRRPGHIAGPYRTTAEFIDEYARYRGRQILSHRLMDSYERRMRQKAVAPRN